MCGESIFFLFSLDNPGHWTNSRNVGDWIRHDVDGTSLSWNNSPNAADSRIHVVSFCNSDSKGNCISNWRLQNGSHFSMPQSERYLRIVTKNRRRCGPLHSTCRRYQIAALHVSVVQKQCIGAVAETKWPPFCRRSFQMHFLEWKYMNFNQYFTEVCSQGYN